MFKMYEFGAYDLPMGEEEFKNCAYAIVAAKENLVSDKNLRRVTICNDYGVKVADFVKNPIEREIVNRVNSEVVNF